MEISNRALSLACAATARYEERTQIRERRLEQADEGNVLAADDPERVAKRYEHLRNLEQRITAAPMLSEFAAAVQSEMAREIEEQIVKLALERSIGRDDMVPPQFLILALAASRCVGRITVRGRGGSLLGYGTGTVVAPGVLLTNNHVLESAADAAESEITFGFETGSTDPDGVRVVGFDPQRLFLTDKELDFTLVALAAVDRRNTPTDDLDYITLNPAEGKALNGEFVNIIQHPNGGMKMLALRENRIVDVLPNFLHYVADTAPGSSGSPVFNDQFELIALHHSGVPARDAQQRVLNRDGKPWTTDQGEADVQWIANEGIRVSMLVERAKSLARSASDQALLTNLCDPARSTPLPETAMATRKAPEPALAGIKSAPFIEDGVATWTIPLSVSVRLGGLAAQTPPPAAASSVLAGIVSDASAPAAALTLAQAVERAKLVFKSVSGVLHIRPGWQFSDGWITDKPAIVVVVEEKKTTATLKKNDEPKLPTQLEGYPVDVRQATAEELYELTRIGHTAASSLFERTANPTYEKPSDLSLDRVKERMKITVHVSPEYGWPVLQAFLAGTNRTLTVAMYDFGANHIIKMLAERLEEVRGKLQLIIQYGSSVGTGTKIDDLDDAATVEILEQRLGNSFALQWANVGQSRSLWASSYHIKVAVRDSKTVWLSSGNWQSSNQAPDAPPADEDAAKLLLQGYNREWHVVVENQALANIFESYIKYDCAQSNGFTPNGLVEAYELLEPMAPQVDERTIEGRWFPPLELDRVVDVQPILTPDNYFDEVLPLIQSAKLRLYFQNQYINESLDERATDTYVRLVETIAEKQQAGVDVRIILRSDNGVDARHVEFMKTCGLDMTRVRWRKHTHTKGIIVDGKRVLLGSHNWSFDGTMLNRDASLLFYDPEIAEYLEQVFLYDWENWSTSRVSIRKAKPKVEEVVNANERAEIRRRVATGEIAVRRLFHPDD